MGSGGSDIESSVQTSSASAGAEAGETPDFDRTLGVVEAITWVTRACPNGVVVGAAERALEAIKAGGAEAMREQAYFVLIAIRGWRGDRARQVHQSLTAYMEQSNRPG